MGVQSESYAMVGGSGEYSYAKNSFYQRDDAEECKDLVFATISENLNLTKNQSMSSEFRIADLGCSVGPNTFDAMNTLIEAVQDKYRTEGQSFRIPEFFVYFNVHVTNDFNTLFTNLPTDRQYYAAGVPGSFHGRLFLKSSLDFIYSSIAVHWLSKVPKDLLDPNSAAFNRNRIYYIDSQTPVCDAYSRQFAEDMKIFFRARAEELIPGGLMALLLPGRADGTARSQYSSIAQIFIPLESILLDLAKEGRVSKSKIDLFNMPMYFPAPEELKNIVQTNECLEILQLNTLQKNSMPIPSKQVLRAAFDGVLTKHFGVEIVEEVFDRYEKEIPSLRLRNTADGNGVLIYMAFRRKILQLPPAPLQKLKNWISLFIALCLF